MASRFEEMEEEIKQLKFSLKKLEVKATCWDALRKAYGHRTIAGMVKNLSEAMSFIESSYDELLKEEKEEELQIVVADPLVTITNKLPKEANDA